MGHWLTYLLGYFGRLASLGTTRAIGFLHFFWKKSDTLSLLLSKHQGGGLVLKRNSKAVGDDGMTCSFLSNYVYEYVQLQVPCCAPFFCCRSL